MKCGWLDKQVGMIALYREKFAIILTLSTQEIAKIWSIWRTRHWRKWGWIVSGLRSDEAGNILLSKWREILEVPKGQAAALNEKVFQVGLVQF